MSDGRHASPPDHPGVLIWPPLLFAATVGLGVGLHFVHPVRLFPTLPSRLTGAGLLCAAGGLALWAGRAMQAAGTHIHPHLPTTAVVTTGPYRLTRNPMYVSLCVLQVAIALLIDDLWPLLCVGPLALTLHFGVIRREERYLAAKFGNDYLAFKGRVRRWL